MPGRITLLLEQFRDGHPIGEAADRRILGEGGGKLRGHETGAARATCDAGGVALQEPRAFGREPVNVRRPGIRMPVTGEVAPTQVIGEEKDDVGRLARREGHTGSSDAKYQRKQEFFHDLSADEGTAPRVTSIAASPVSTQMKPDPSVCIPWLNSTCRKSSETPCPPLHPRGSGHKGHPSCPKRAVTIAPLPSARYLKFEARITPTSLHTSAPAPATTPSCRS